MGLVANNFVGMGAGQLLLVLAMLGGYAIALGRFFDARARLVAAATVVLAAGGFVALSASWLAAVILVPFIPVGMGAFAGAVWMLWAVAARLERRAAHEQANPSSTAAQGVPSDAADQPRAITVSMTPRPVETSV